MITVLSWIPIGLCFMAVLNEMNRKDRKFGIMLIEIMFGLLLYYWFPIIR